MASIDPSDPAHPGSEVDAASVSPGPIQWIYRTLFNLGLLLSFPYYFRRMSRRGGWRDRVGQRFGKYEPSFIENCRTGKRIWVHAVSVGEVHLTLELIRRLREHLSDTDIIVSATTTTGMGEWHKKLPREVKTCFYPIDRRPWVRRAMETIRPEAIILSEAEVWPNFLWEAAERGIPVFLVNARISEKSYRRYTQFGFLFRPLFQSFACVGTQNESDALRLKKLGCTPDRIKVTGNMKFDAALSGNKQPTLNVPQLFADAGIDTAHTILLGSSTHPGEEAILGEIYLNLIKQHPQLQLVIVPRHFERAQDAGKDLENQGFTVAYRSEWKEGHPFQRTAKPFCLIVNSTGELASVTAQADLVFIGKSLCARGGQSPIEAAAAGKAMVMGPNMQNFRAITRTFLEYQAALQVQDKNSLEEALLELLNNDRKRIELGTKARQVVNQNIGAVDRTLEMLTTHSKIARLLKQIGKTEIE